MNYAENLSEGLVVLAAYYPPSTGATAGAKTVPAFSMANMRRVAFIINMETLGTSATIDFKLQASAVSGSGFADVTGWSITQVLQASSPPNIVILELKAESLGTPTTPVGPWIQGILTVGTATSWVSVLAIGESGYYPASDFGTVNGVAPIQTTSVTSPTVTAKVI